MRKIQYGIELALPREPNRENPVPYLTQTFRSNAINTASSISSIIGVPPPLGIKIGNSFQMFPCRWVIGSSHGGRVGEMLVKGEA